MKTKQAEQNSAQKAKNISRCLGVTDFMKAVNLPVFFCP
jgi:hypothetical protein